MEPMEKVIQMVLVLYVVRMLKLKYILENNIN